MAMANAPKPSRAFWEEKSLEEMNVDEWESLCDGCGRCCLLKLQDSHTGEVSYTSVACRLMDLEKCSCTKYAERNRLVPDCVKLRPDNIAELKWMPSTCAYRLLYEGRPLESWHPLVSGDPESVHKAGISIRHRAISEREAGDVEDYILDEDF